MRGNTGDGIKHTYTLDGTKILREEWNGNTLIPLYDNEETVCGILYNNEPYYFQKNLQGDIIGIVDKSSKVVANYFYDAWGVCSIAQDSSNCQIATINPYRYRGYYFDEEIGIYYLQHRYYNPSVGRFINADMPEMMLFGNMVTSGVEINVYSYSQNSPIVRMDELGCLSGSVMRVVNSLSAAALFSQFANALYTALTATLAKISAYVTGILLPKIAALFWWQPWVVAGIVIAAVAIVVAAVSVARSKALSKADTKVRTKLKNKKYTYFEAYRSSGLVTVGSGITQATAIRRLRSGQHVFTMYGYNARKVCALAGSATPMWHAREYNSPNYYNHYHINKHTNSAHCWYLI